MLAQVLSALFLNQKQRQDVGLATYAQNPDWVQKQDNYDELLARWRQGVELPLTAPATFPITSESAPDNAASKGIFTASDAPLKVKTLFDGHEFPFELGVVNLRGMAAFAHDAQAFVAEAVRRILSQSELGYLLLSDGLSQLDFDSRAKANSTEHPTLPPGDPFTLLMTPEGPIADLPKTPALEPLFAFLPGAIADLTGAGQILSLAPSSNHQHNNLVLQVEGATIPATPIATVLSNGEHWQDTQWGQFVVEQFSSEEEEFAVVPAQTGHEPKPHTAELQAAETATGKLAQPTTPPEISPQQIVTSLDTLLGQTSNSQPFEPIKPAEVEPVERDRPLSPPPEPQSPAPLTPESNAQSESEPTLESKPIAAPIAEPIQQSKSKSALETEPTEPTETQAVKRTQTETETAITLETQNQDPLHPSPFTPDPNPAEVEQPPSVTEPPLSPLPLPPDPTPGTFLIDESGQVTVDFLFDGGGLNQGKVALFSLEGITAEPGSREFVQEAARRALSNSELGQVVLSDATDGAKFSGRLGEADRNRGDYQGARTVQMRPGDRVGMFLSLHPDLVDVAAGKKTHRVLFSLPSANRDGNPQFAQVTELAGAGNAFAFEDWSLSGSSDRDYNDIILTVRGATPEAVPPIDALIQKPWQETEQGKTFLDLIRQDSGVVTYSDRFLNPSEDFSLIGRADAPELVESVEVWMRDRHSGNWTQIETITEFDEAGRFRSGDGTELDAGNYEVRTVTRYTSGLSETGEVRDFTVLSLGDGVDLSPRVKAALRRAVAWEDYNEAELERSDEWIVSIQSEQDADAIAQSLGLTNLGAANGIPNSYRWQIPQGMDRDNLMQALRDAKGIQYAYPLVPLDLEFHSPANEPLIANGSQWHLTTANASNVQTAWQLSQGANTTVGIIDDGFAYQHSDLADTYNQDLSQSFVGDADGNGQPDPDPYFKPLTFAFQPGIGDDDERIDAMESGETKRFRLPVPLTGQIQDLQLSFEIDHSELEKLELTLIQSLSANHEKRYTIDHTQIHDGQFSATLSDFIGSNFVQAGDRAGGKWLLEAKQISNGTVSGHLDDFRITIEAYNAHGTQVAGIIAADGDNGFGGSGVAPEAEWAGFSVNLPQADADSLTEVLEYENGEIDIYNNSWGANFYGGLENLAAQEYLFQTLEQGRDGKGNIYVFSAGNSGETGGNVNYNAYANSRHTIAVGAVDASGQAAPYSTPGSSVLISAYSGLKTTTLDGSYSDDASLFHGTSASAPFVSGVVSLMLSANPELTWRDVQHILVHTAQKINPDDPDWTTNGAGYDIHPKYGFGLIDAEAAVKAAQLQGWNVPKYGESFSASELFSQDRLEGITGYIADPEQDQAVWEPWNVTIFDGQENRYEFGKNLPSGKITNVEISLELLHEQISDLTATLVHKASGAEVILFDNYNFQKPTNSGDWHTLTFSDVAPRSLDTPNLESGGIYQPLQSLSESFAGLDKQSEWELVITDNQTGNQTNAQELGSWYLTFATEAEKEVTILENQDLILDWVEIEVMGWHDDKGDLQLVLEHTYFDEQEKRQITTESVLSDSHHHPYEGGRHDWFFTSARHWGEPAHGTWTLKVSDEVSGDTGELTGWDLHFYGTDGSNTTPEATPLTQDHTYIEDQTVTLQPILVEDVDGDVVSVVLSLSEPGAGTIIGGGLSSNAEGVWIFSGTPEAATAALADVQFVPADDFNGNLTIASSVTDGHILNPLTGTISLVGTPMNDAPRLGDGLLTGLTVGQPFTISYQDLVDATGAKDIEGNAITLTVDTLQSGTITQNGQPVAGTIELTAGQTLEWTPDEAGDSVAAFTVVASDGQDAATPVSITAAVTALPPATVSLIPGIADASEDGAIGSFTLTRVGGDIAQPLLVRYTLSGTAENGADYDLPGTVTFAPGEYFRVIAVTPTDDLLYEGTEYLKVELDAGAGYTPHDTFASHTINITDNEWAPEVTLQVLDGVASEDGNAGRIAVQLDQATTQDTVVSYQVSGGEDAAPLTGSVVVKAGEQFATFGVSALHDYAAEAGESVVITLSGGTGYVLGSEVQGSVVIEESAEAFRYGPFVYEFGGKQYLLSTPDTWHGAQSQAEALGGNLVAIADQTENNWLLDTFPTDAKFWIGITDSEFYNQTEGDFGWVNNESLDFTNWRPGEPNGNTGEDFAELYNYSDVLGLWNDTPAENSGGQVLSGIIEIDPTHLEKPIVNVMVTDAEAGEDDNAGQIVFTRVGDISQVLTVEYAVGGSASNGADYTELSGVVTFAPGQLVATVGITPLADFEDEGVETVVLTLKDTGAYALGLHREGQVSIEPVHPVNQIAREVIGRDLQQFESWKNDFENGEPLESLRRRIIELAKDGNGVYETETKINESYQRVLGRDATIEEVEDWRRQIIEEGKTLSDVSQSLVGVVVPIDTLNPVYQNPVTGNFYYLTTVDTWLGAQEQAEAAGGNLVTINDVTENQWLVDTFGIQSTGYWIGFNDSPIHGNTEGNFSWVSGEVGSFTNWHPEGEPNNTTGTWPEGEDFTHTAHDAGEYPDAAYWNDLGLSSTLFGIRELVGIVEIPGTPNSADFLTPDQPYLSFDDSPFKTETFSAFHLETFEDGLLNKPGVEISTGRVIDSVSEPTAVDSVDADDGSIDGSGLQGKSWHPQTQDWIITFDAQVLGQLPTHVGFAMTDIARSDDTGLGIGRVMVEGFDANGKSIGQRSIEFGDDQWGGQTEEDRFIGVVYDQGIASLRISLPDGNPGGEIDHLQYGIAHESPSANFFTPEQPYLEFADSPFSDQSFSKFHLENFEDDQLNIPGVRISEGEIINLSRSNAPDSVDEDNGSIDGSGLQGHSWYAQGAQELTIDFDAQVIGGLPTHAGLAITDISYLTDSQKLIGEVQIEAFDADGQSLGLRSIGQFGDNDAFGQTSEDRFLGVQYDQGISRIKITLPDGNPGLEIDHIQYGIAGEEPQPLSTEKDIRINTYTPGHQGGEPGGSGADITALTDGGFVVVWESEAQGGSGYGIYGQRYDAEGVPVGREFSISDTQAGDQKTPAVTALPEGEFLVVWSSPDSALNGIFGQRFNSNGTTNGGEFQINTTESQMQTSADVTVLADGSYLVTWTSYEQPGDGSDEAIVGRRFTLDGQPPSNEFIINTTTTWDQEAPDITPLKDGGFIATWHSDSDDNNGYRIMAQRFNASNQPEGQEIQVPLPAQGGQVTPSVAELENGGFVITWRGEDAHQFGTFAQRYTADGQQEGEPFLVNTETFGGQNDAMVVSLEDGGFLIAWASGFGGYQHFGIRAQRYDGNGDKVGEAFVISEPDSYQRWPKLTRLGNGNVIATWQGFEVVNGEATPSSEIFGRIVEINPINVAPRLSEAALGEATQYQATTITYADLLAASAATDANGDEIRFRIETVQQGLLTLNGEAIATGETLVVLGDTLEWVPFESGDTLTGFSVRATDGEAFSDAVAVNFDVARSLVEGEFKVNEYNASAQRDPAIAALSDGSYMVVWNSTGQEVGGTGYGIYGRRLDAGGNRIGSDEDMHISSYTQGHQIFADVVGLTDGGYVVVWSSAGQEWAQEQTGSGYGIYSQRYNSNNQKVGGEQLVNAGITHSHQDLASVTATSNGGYIVAWQSNDDSGTNVNVYARQYDAVGGAGEILSLSTTTAGAQSNPALTALANDEFVATWTAADQDGSGFGIYSRRFRADGSAIDTTEVLVNQTTTESQSEPAITTLTNGSYVIAWQAEDSDGSSYGIMARQFSANGQPLGNEFSVNSTIKDYQAKPAVTALSDGGFAITWQSYGQDGSEYGVYGQRFNAAGDAMGDEFRATETTAGQQRHPVIAGSTLDDSFLVVWQDSGADNSGEGVFAQRFENEPDPAASNVAPELSTVNFERGTYQHDGSAAPTTEGWLGYVHTDNNAEAVEDNGTPAWLIQDLSTAAQSAVSYTQAVSDLEAMQARQYGWTTSARFRIGETDDLPHGSIATSYRDGFNSYTVFWGSEGGETKVRLTTDQGVEDVVLSGVTATEYHDYDLVFDAATETIKIFVDGEEKLSGYKGNSLSGRILTDNHLKRGVYWGSLGSGDTGESYWQSVDFSINKPEITQYKPHTITYAELLAASDATDANGDVLGFRIEGVGDGDLTLNGDPITIGQTLVRPGDELQWASNLAGDDVLGFQVSAVDALGAASNVVDVAFDVVETPLTPIENNAIFRVDSNADYSKSSPEITELSGGGFVVTWESFNQDGDGFGVYGQKFTPSGEPDGQEFQVNISSSGYQHEHSSSTLSNGDFAVSWYDADSGEIYIRIYNAQEDSQEIIVENPTSSWRRDPSISGLSDGNFVVTWMSNNQDGDDWGIYGKIYTNSGTSTGSEFLINSEIENSQMRPSVSSLLNGEFIVVWESYTQGGSVYGQKYDSQGNRIGNEFRVNLSTVEKYDRPSVTSLNNGGFVIVWDSYDSNAGTHGVHGQKYGEDGSRIGGEFTVSSQTSVGESNVQVTGLEDGSFIVAWEEGNTRTFVQRYGSNSQPVGEKVQLNEINLGPRIFNPSISGLVNGDFVATWLSETPQNKLGVYARRFTLTDLPQNKTTHYRPFTPYTNPTNSPFQTANLPDLQIEDFQDNLINQGNDALIIQNHTNANIINEAGIATDDPLLNNRNALQVNSTELTLDFAQNFSHVGLVITDINQGSTAIIEAFDRQGVSLGQSDAQTFSNAADEFLGISNNKGIASVKITTNDDSWEVDHIQYG